MTPDTTISYPPKENAIRTINSEDESSFYFPNDEEPRNEYVDIMTLCIRIGLHPIALRRAMVEEKIPCRSAVLEGETKFILVAKEQDVINYFNSL